MVVQIFQLFFLVPHRGEGFPVCHNLYIHRGINGKGKLLLLIVKDFRGWEVQFPHNAVNGEVGGIYRPVFLFDFQIPLVFLYQTTGGFDEVIVFHQRFLLKPLLRQVILIIFIGDSGLSV